MNTKMNIQDIQEVQLPEMKDKYPTEKDWYDAIVGSFDGWLKKWKDYHLNKNNDNPKNTN